MITWQITQKNTIEQINKKEILDDIENSKVKITKILLDDYVYELYTRGSDPIIPASFAVGVVSEFGNDDVYEFEKGSRVYISAFKYCEECFECVTNNETKCSNMMFSGRNTDGMLKEFAIVPNSQLYALPSSVTDNDALLLDIIALCITSIDKLDVLKGQHVVVIGKGLEALITCQLLSYYKSIPILVTNDHSTSVSAENLGIFYKYDTNEQPESEISGLTGGRMAHKLIYLTGSDIDTKYISLLSSANAKVVLSGFDRLNINLDLDGVMQKQLDISCVKNGYGEIKTAINLLANKAISTEEYQFKEIKFNDVEKVLKSVKDKSDFEKKVINTMTL